MSFNILSFCGGGMRGLASATMLDNLLTSCPNLISGANMFAGTSTGAGIAGALAIGTSPADIIKGYHDVGVPFFKLGSSDPTKPAYSVDVYHDLIELTYLGKKLSDITDKNLLMTSFNLNAGGNAWEPVLFNNFANSTTADTPLADAVVSSGCMPAMFGAYKGMVDGAFVHHDPTLAAIALAIASGVKLEDIQVICFGTGFMANCIQTDTTTWGATQWLTGNALTKLDTVPSLLLNGTPSPILNAMLNGTSTNLVPQLAAMMLQSSYASLNPILTEYIPEDVTDAATLQVLVDAANDVVLTDAIAIASQW